MRAVHQIVLTLKPSMTIVPYANSYGFPGNPRSIFIGYCVPKWRVGYKNGDQLRRKSRPSFEFDMIGFFSPLWNVTSMTFSQVISMIQTLINFNFLSKFNETDVKNDMIGSCNDFSTSKISERRRAYRNL